MCSICASQVNALRHMLRLRTLGTHGRKLWTQRFVRINIPIVASTSNSTIQSWGRNVKWEGNMSLDTPEASLAQYRNLKLTI
jgi:hypothetical protein